MTRDELLKTKFSGNILIIGHPATGKTTLSKQLLNNLDNHTLIHTDEFMDDGYEQGLYDILDHIKEIPGPTLIEGVQGFRLLRKGAQLGSYYPDVVIDLSTSDKNIEKVYNTERESYKLPYLKGMKKANQKILNDYKQINNPKPPVWIEVWNEY